MITLIVFLFGLFVAAIILAPFIAVIAWVIMLILGALASMLVIPALAIGFVPCVLITCLAAIIF